jgi:hypothetical protein
MTTALSGQQMTLPVWVGAYSCLSFDHYAWLSPWKWHVKNRSVLRTKEEPEMCILSEGVSRRTVEARGPLRTSFINT